MVLSLCDEVLLEKDTSLIPAASNLYEPVDSGISSTPKADESVVESSE